MLNISATFYPITGIKGAWIAGDIQDTETGYSAGTPFFAPPLENATWTAEQGKQPVFGNDAKRDEYFGTEINSIVIRLTGISEEMDAWLRGKAYIAAAGAVAGSGDTEPPLRALGLKIAKGINNAILVWFPKGKFSGGNIVAQTKTDNVTVNVREYTFSALETVRQFTYLNDNTGLMETKGLTYWKGESANPAFNAATFFTQVQTPDTLTPPAALALSSIVPADGATGVAVGADVVITFNNKIAADAIALVSAAGDAVENAMSIDATGKIITINPAGNLDAATNYHVVLVNVKDIYGQMLPVTTKSFTTA